jgi:hypothetical protein
MDQHIFFGELSRIVLDVTKSKAKREGGTEGVNGKN